MEGQLPVQVSRWTCDQVEEWLVQNKFDNYANQMCRQHKVDGRALLALTEKDLREQMEIKMYGDLERLNSSLNRLRYEAKYDIPDDSKVYLENGTSRSSLVNIPSKVPNGNNNWAPNGFMDPSLLESEDHFSVPSPEPFKTLVSFAYFITGFFITTFVLAVVHNRIPDRATHPPLPDIFLDTIPRAPWAFKVAEAFISLQTSTLFTLFVIHKHRMILMRRAFAMHGTLFILRSVTMYVTSLPVPGDHLECTPKLYDNLWAKLNRAFEIALGMGMTSNGIATCGDYMFSGHTATLTLTSFFITEYTPKKYFLLHTATRIMTFLGMICILASHEHYTIDVLAAYYITARLFACYHTLANSGCTAALLNGSLRMRNWLFLFAYFERNIKGRVPNEYEWPFSWPWWLKNIFN